MDLGKYYNNFKQTDTPFYFYDMDLLRSTLSALEKSIAGTNFHVHYALKANANDPILKLIKNSGFGADCVSGNEVKKALELGFDSKHIAFAGVGKTDKEINLALDNDIFAFNCESFEEIEVINELAAAKGKVANIAIRINPNVDAQTHKHITTGLEENKFGINMPDLDGIIEQTLSMQHVKINGIHFHIGSQITKLENYISLCSRANDLVNHFQDKGVELTHVNLGGGLGINYEDPQNHSIAPFEEYFKLFKDHLTLDPAIEVHFELGRSIVGQCGTLISKVLFVKKGVKTSFLIIDAGMTELMRPALYQAHHEILSFSDNQNKVTYDVVGPICESTDYFAKGLVLPQSKRGDVIAILSSGAYAEVMSNTYNMRDKAPAIYSDDLVVADMGH